MTTQDPLVLGIDLGGTKTRVGLVSRSRGLVRVEITATPGEEGPDGVMEHIRSVGRDLLSAEGAQAAAVGLGAPGPIDGRTGVVSTMPNLPGWEDYPMQSALSELFGVPAVLANDADAAAVGEHRFGAGVDVDNILYITLGTGVGGGLIINSKLYPGSTGAAGEIGHMVIDPEGPLCGCGRHGCLEAYCSGSGLERRARERLNGGDPSLIVDLAGSISAVSCEHVADAGRAGDTLARELLRDGSLRLAQAMVSLVHVLNPELVLFGGGLVAMKDVLIEPAIALTKGHVFPQHLRGLRFAYSILGDDAGVLGAASLAFDSLSQK